MNRKAAIQHIIGQMERLPHFKQKGNEYRSASPIRPGSDGDSFTFTVTEDEAGKEFAVWYDHKESTGGDLLDLCKTLNIELDSTLNGNGHAAADNTLRAYRDLAEYAAAQGADVQAFVDAGWNPQVQTIQGRPALTYATEKGTHIRFIDGKKPKYKPEKTGYEKCWYGLERAVQRATERNTFIVITNGAPSVVVAQYYGIPAAAVIGGENALTQDLLSELRNKWRGGVVIALDCDEQGRKAAKAIEAQLVGLPVAVMDLNLTDKGDLAQFCKLHGDDTYSAFYAKAPTPKAVSQVELLKAQAVRDLADSSKALTNAIRADAEAKRQMDVAALVSRVRSDLERVEMQTAKAVITPAKTVVERNRQRLKQAMSDKRRIIGLHSGIPTLDSCLRGFLPGDVNIIYGAASMGKSTLAVSMTACLMTQGYGMVIPTESQPERWLNKLVAAITRIPLVKIDTGELNDAEQDRVEAAYSRIEKTVNLDFLEGARPTPQQIHTAVLEYKPCWVVIDSGSNLAFPGTSAIYDRTVGVSNSIAETAMLTNTHVLMTWQVNRSASTRGDGDKIPRMTDAQGGEVVSQDAARIIGIYNHNYYVDEGSEVYDDRFPRGTSIIKVIKDRWYNAKGRTVTLKHFDDAGLGELKREVSA